MTPLELFHPGTEGLLWNRFTSWDRTTPGESFCPRMKGLQGSHSVLGWNDSRGVILSWDGTTPGESFCHGMERLLESHSVLGWKDSRGVLLSWDRTTPGESFCHGMERLLESQSYWNDSRGVILPCSHSVLVSFCPGVILSWIQPRTVGLQDRTTPGESFCPWMERLLGKFFCHGMKRLQVSQSGRYDSRGVILSLDGTTPE